MDQKTRNTLFGKSRGTTWCAVLCILGAVLLFSGCATGSADLTDYNPQTGYPVVGAQAWN